MDEQQIRLLKKCRAARHAMLRMAESLQRLAAKLKPAETALISLECARGNFDSLHCEDINQAFATIQEMDSFVANLIGKGQTDAN